MVKSIKHLPASLLWSIPYAAMGVFSLALNSPISRAPIVWLPSGVAVAALLLARPRQRAAVFSAIFMAALVVCIWHGENAATCVIIALTAVLAAGTAGGAIALARRARRLPLALVLLIGALAGSVASLPGSFWLIYRELHDPCPYVAAWMFGYVAGVLIMTPVILSWAGFRPRRSTGPRPSDFWLGLAFYFLLMLTTFLVFDHELIQGHPAVIAFELTYIPVVFAVLTGLVWGARGGSLATLTLALVALVQAAQGGGPFSVPNLTAAQTLLATQVYLMVGAYLLLLVNTVRSARERDLEYNEARYGRLEMALDGSRQLAYFYDPVLDRFELAGNLQRALGVPSSRLVGFDAVMPHIHPLDRERFRHWWMLRREGQAAMQDFEFRAGSDATGWRLVRDRGATLDDLGRPAPPIAGVWRFDAERD
jgi:integral membrane sensor domain MASE1